MEKVFVVMTVNSYFIGVYSSHEKAQEVVVRLGGEYMGAELIVEEHKINDLSMFNKI